MERTQPKKHLPPQFKKNVSRNVSLARPYSIRFTDVSMIGIQRKNGLVCTVLSVYPISIFPLDLYVDPTVVIWW